MALKYQRILLKISGEALGGEKGTGFDEPTMDAICGGVKKAHDLGVQIGIVVGGGNFWRGRSSGKMERTLADKIGMLATVMNALAVSDKLEQLGVETVVMMSGLPAGCPSDKTPVWITTSWPPETQDILDYQWNEVAIPKWKELVRMAEDCGIRQIALENHGMQLVYNPETLFRLREAVGPMVGMNLDPSHLFWMGGDPIEAARVLGEQGALYHVHGKDSRPERRMAGPNGLLDTKPIDQFRTRSWNYVAVGCGHGAQWWKEFFSTVRMAGYDGDVSLEMEDLTMPMLEGHLTSLRVLKEALVL